jgi:hypothetical protein
VRLDINGNNEIQMADDSFNDDWHIDFTNFIK